MSRRRPSSLPSALPLPVGIALRYLRGRKKSRLLGGTARAALAAIALGVMAMVIAMALMTGYRQDLQRKLVGGNAALVAYPLRAGGPGAGVAISAETWDALAAVDGVESVRAVSFGQGTLVSAARPDGVVVTLRGVDPGVDALGEGTPPLPAAPAAGGVPILLGEELAAALAAAPGDTLRLVALGFAEGRAKFSYLSVVVAGTFRAGLSEFDREWAILDRGRVERLSEARALRVGETGPASPSSLIEFRLADPALAAERAEEVRAILGEGYLVSDWQSLNGELFTALEVQQIALFLVLGLIVLVSTFNVASTLVVLVRERMREVGVLTALGLRPEAMRYLFLVYGLLLGATGTALGLGLGAATAWTLDALRVIRFNPEVAAIYFIDAVPFQVRVSDLAAIAAFSLVVNVLACLGPALRAARVDPVVALRYE